MKKLSESDMKLAHRLERAFYIVTTQRQYEILDRAIGEVLKERKYERRRPRVKI